MTNELTNKESKEKLIQYIESIENLENQKKEIQDEIRDRFESAKSEGFDVKAMKAIIKIRKKDKSEVEEEEYLIQLYKDVLGI